MDRRPPARACRHLRHRYRRLCGESNHYHVVLHVDQQQGLTWNDAEVIERWHRLFRGNLLSQRFSRGEKLDRAEWQVLAEVVAKWHERLISISWFMRCINEPVAREANREDNVTGRFWEGRYTSQALLDEKALAACMVYVDLNPIRAQMATTPEASDQMNKRGRYPISLFIMTVKGSVPFFTLLLLLLTGPSHIT